MLYVHIQIVYIYNYICIVLFILYVYVPQAQLNQSCIDCEPVCDEKRQRWCFGRIAWSWCWYGDAREERHELKRKERSIKTHQLAWNPFEFLLCFHSFRTTWPPVILVCSTAIQVEGMAQVHTPTCKAQSPQPEFTLAPSRYVSRVAADWAVPLHFFSSSAITPIIIDRNLCSTEAHLPFSHWLAYESYRVIQTNTSLYVLFGSHRQLQVALPFSKLPSSGTQEMGCMHHQSLKMHGKDKSQWCQCLESATYYILLMLE